MIGYVEPRLKRRLELDEFQISVQIDPPYVNKKKNVWQTTQEFWDMLRALKNSGVKLIDINSSRGKGNKLIFTSTQLAGSAAKKFRFDVIPHVATRDLSLAGLINEVETTFVLSDITDFLIITGDPHDTDQKFPHTGVFEMDSVGAMEALNKYLRPRDVFSLAAAVNQNKRGAEIERLRKKVDAGADFFMSQTVFVRKKLSGPLNFTGSIPKSR